MNTEENINSQISYNIEKYLKIENYDYIEFKDRVYSPIEIIDKKLKYLRIIRDKQPKYNKFLYQIDSKDDVYFLNNYKFLIDKVENSNMLYEKVFKKNLPLIKLFRNTSIFKYLRRSLKYYNDQKYNKYTKKEKGFLKFNSFDFFLKSCESILILKLDHIGDFYISTPIFKEIRKKFPRSNIDIVVGSWNEKICKSLEIFDNVYTNDYLKNESSFVHKINQASKTDEYFTKSYDVLLNLRYGSDLEIFEHSIKAKKILSMTNNLINNKINLINTQINYKYNNFYTLLNIAAPLLNLDLHKNFDREIQTKTEEKFIIFNPFSNSPLRTFNFDQIISTLGYLNTLNFPIYFCGLFELPVNLNKKINKLSNIHNYVNKTNLDEYESLMKNSKLIISANSSTVHFAALNNLNAIAIYFGTHHPSEWASNNSKITYFFTQDECSPCFLSSEKECPYNQKCKRLFDLDKLKREISIRMNDE